MRLDEFDYQLPEELIALRPARPRPASRLLVAGPEAIRDSTVARLGDWLERGDLLVFNDTRVIPARLAGVRRRADGAEARIEATLIAAAGEGRWRALARPGKRLALGDRIVFGALTAEVLAKDGAEVVLAFDQAGAAFEAALAAVGEMPLPPYIAGRRAPDERDRADYQTLYARAEGAVAAPTAGLHFTDALLRRVDERGIGRVFVTLHVGPGTFLPVKAEDTAEHRMHAEFGTVSAEAAAALNAARARGGRIVAVGTTALRLLESAAGENGTIAPFAGDTDIFITPGYRFRAVDALMTNFHLPRSTLFMLVCAFSGLDAMKAAYAHAIAAGYRFYSYGDACLLFPANLSRTGEVESAKRTG
jgi:S-adenosylmethionine:tRNA ribosyltransferase-isomerase